MATPPPSCARCRDADGQTFPIGTTVAFQPIVSLSSRSVFAHEALIRGTEGQSAGQVLGAVSGENQYSFDQDCRVTAIQWASRLGIAENLSINFLPNAVYNPTNCLRRTIWAAEQYDFPLERIIFELTEHESVVDLDHLRDIIETYRSHGLRTAIDDFGAGYSGLGLLAELQPDYIKLDRALLRDLDADRRRRAILRGTMQIANDLGVTVIAEGVERAEEVACLSDLGVDLMQGYYFAEPAFEALVPSAEITWPG